MARAPSLEITHRQAMLDTRRQSSSTAYGLRGVAGVPFCQVLRQVTSAAAGVRQWASAAAVRTSHIVAWPQDIESSEATAVLCSHSACRIHCQS